MRKTNLSTLMLLLVLLASSCKQQSMEIFNGKDLSNWEFVLRMMVLLQMRFIQLVMVL